MNRLPWVPVGVMCSSTSHGIPEYHPAVNPPLANVWSTAVVEVQYSRLLVMRFS